MRMLDSVDVAHLPDGAAAYAGYTTGLFPTWEALKARFGGKAHLLSIAINAAEHAICLDVEQGDAQPWQAPGWVKTEHARNVARPVLYASVSKMATVAGYLRHAGIPLTAVRLWSAHYGAGEHICGPATCKLIAEPMDATQWRDDAPGVGGAKVDESVLAGDFFTAPPAPPVELYGYLVTQGAIGNIHALTGHAVTSRDGGHSWT
jgi:hypothetical protein